MGKKITLLLITLLFPLAVSAQNAGFPEETLWLSDSSPAVGATIQIYTILYNSTGAVKSDTLTFLVDGSPIGTQTISLPSGESRIFSQEWTATSGSHTFAAKFGAGGSTTAQQSTSVSLSVAEPPSPIVQALSDAKDVSSQVVASSTPVIQNIAEKTFAVTEAARNAGVAFLEKRIDPPAKNSATTSNVEGFTAPESASSSAAKSSTLHNISQIAAVGMLYAFKTSWLFYLLALLLCYLLFKFVRGWVNRPRF